MYIQCWLGESCYCLVVSEREEPSEEPQTQRAVLVVVQSSDNSSGKPVTGDLF